jgi:hypothetical protein
MMAAMNQLIFSRLQPRQVDVAVLRLLGGMLAPEVVTSEAFWLVQVEVLVIKLGGWGILTSCEIILNFSNYVKLCNKTLRCLSLFYNKSALAIHNWHN